MTLKHSECHQTWYELVDPMQGYNHSKFEWCCLNGDWESLVNIFLSNQEACQLFPLNRCKSKKTKVCSNVDDVIKYHTKFQLNTVSTQLNSNITFSVKTIWHCCEYMVRVTKSGMNSQSSMSRTIMFSLTSITFKASEKNMTVKFSMHCTLNWLA